MIASDDLATFLEPHSANSSLRGVNWPKQEFTGHLSLESPDQEQTAQIRLFFLGDTKMTRIMET